MVSSDESIKSALCDFYKDKTILLTGGSGFLGKAVIAKILRDLSNIRRLYVLMRPKRLPDGSTLSALARLSDEVLKSPAFDKLRRDLGEQFDQLIAEKLVAVTGDLMHGQLGMELEIYNQLAGEVDVIINCAAEVSFDAPLERAVRLNAIAPKHVLEFAQRCAKRPILIHVSTCYVNGMREGVVHEEPLPPTVSMWHLRCGVEASSPEIEPYDVDAEVEAVLKRACELIEESHSKRNRAIFERRARQQLSRISSYSEQELEKRIEMERAEWLKQRLIDEGMQWARRRGWNDTYTFTKAMGEQLLVRYRGDVPVVILRPAIIESSLREPLPGWIEGLRMADPIIIGYGRGRLPDFPGDPNCIIDLVPVDLVVNALLASALLPADEPKLHVIHVATGTENPLTFGELYHIGRNYFLANPLQLNENDTPPSHYPEWTFPSRDAFLRRLHWRWLLPIRFCEAFTRWLRFIPPLRRLNARCASLRMAFERLRYYVEIYGPYTEVRCRYDTTNLRMLWQRLHQSDRERFPFDVRSIDWQYYIQRVHIPGLLRFVLHKEDVQIPAPTVKVEEMVQATREVTDEQRQADAQRPIRIIPDLIARSAAVEPHKVALQIRRGKQWVRYTFADVDRMRRIMAASLHQHGVGHGDRVVLYSENQPEWGIAYLAASSLGAAVVPLDRQLPPEHVWAIAQWADAKVIMASQSCIAQMTCPMDDKALSATEEPPRIPILNINNRCLPIDAPEDAPHPPPIDLHEHEGRIQPDDVASIILTTGPAHEPKAAMLSHRNFLSNVMAITQVLKPNPTEHFLSILPLHHALEFTGGFLVPLFACVTVSYIETLRSRVVLETMREAGATCLIGVPRVFQVLHDAIQAEVRRRGKFAQFIFRTSIGISKAIYNLTGWRIGRVMFPYVHRAFGGRLRVFISGGAALDPRIFDDFTAMGFLICEGYGLTETSPVVTVNPMERPKKGSVGPPLPNVEVRIAHPDERGIGEILVRGPNVMLGYFNDRESTERVICDGWLHTGDLGYIDEDGYLHLTGRIKEVIVTAAGKNVYPDEVEALYRDLPDVKELCVVGVWDEGTMGEVVHAVVVPHERFWRNTAQIEEFSQRLLKAMQEISTRIPSYQRIQQVHVWTNELPKTPALSIDRSEVRRLLMEQLERGELTVTPPTAPVTAHRVQESPIPSTSTDGQFQARVLETIARVANKSYDEISLDQHLEIDLHMDSLMKVELLVALEAQFHTPLPESMAPALQTVQDVVQALAERVNGARIEPVADEAVELPPVEAGIYWARVLTTTALSEDEVRQWIDASIGKRVCRWLARKVLGWIYRYYLGFEVLGVENLPSNEPFIIAANHSSHLDSGAVLLAVGKHAPKLRIVGARDYFFNTRLRSWLFHTCLGVIPFDRQAHFAEGLRLAREVLMRGHPLLIFPEGTRSPTGEMQPFKPGLGLLAFETNVPVIPTLIEGTYEAMSRERRFPVRHPICICFGKPISMDAYREALHRDNIPRHELYRRIANDVQKAVEALKKMRA